MAAGSPWRCTKTQPSFSKRYASARRGSFVVARFPQPPSVAAAASASEKDVRSDRRPRDLMARERRPESRGTIPSRRLCEPASRVYGAPCLYPPPPPSPTTRQQNEPAGLGGDGLQSCAALDARWA